MPRRDRESEDLPDDDDRPRRRRPDDDADDRPRRRRTAPSGGGVPVWAWVLGGVALLGMMGCGGMILLFFAGAGAVKQAAQRVADEQKAAQGQKVKWGESRTFGPLRVSIRSASVRAYGGTSPAGVALESTVPGLVIDLLIETDDKTKEHGAKAATGVAILRDSLGNEISRMGLRTEFGLRAEIHGQLAEGRSFVVRSDKPLTDTLVFSKPVEAAGVLTLELPARNYGGDGRVLFEIPEEAWRSGKK
ncbi:hypothetical protein J0H58_28845 [bacterium]|nr:hypothetical protein [bacterium]